ncbi:MAG: hypothetical protein IKZ07_02930 [Akkermansia sp.]|nr:hypothetical protein [Akkermansia sp.]
MKLFTILPLIAIAITAAAEPTTAWARGVCEQSGWRDFDKKFDGSDNEQCWAITAGNLIDGARAGAAFWIGVSYVSPKGRPAMHSLNVWGVEYTASDDKYHIRGIWIADSDDYKHGITYVPVKEDKGMLIFNSPEHPIYGRISRIEIDTITSLKATF